MNLSLRDLLMYLIPGFLTIIITKYLFQDFGYTFSLFNEKNDFVGIMIIVSASYLLGIIISSFTNSPVKKYIFKSKSNYFDPFYYLMIIVKLFLKEQKDLMTISNLDFKDDFKTNLINKAKIDFNIDNDESITNNSQIFFFCSRYVELHANVNGLKQLHRDFELGNFFITSSFPLILTEIYFIKITTFLLFVKIGLMILIPFITICFVIQRSSFFRNAWIRNVYRLYYLTEKKIKTTANAV